MDNDDDDDGGGGDDNTVELGYNVMNWTEYFLSL
jgi:hypothetical protein